MAEEKKEATAGIEEKVLRLRPHHLKTLRDYLIDFDKRAAISIKQGYGGAYVINAYHLLQRLAMPHAFVEIVSALDDFCGSCKLKERKCRVPDGMPIFSREKGHALITVPDTEYMLTLGMRIWGTYPATHVVKRVMEVPYA